MRQTLRFLIPAAVLTLCIGNAGVLYAAENVTVPVRHLQLLPDPDGRGTVLGAQTTVPVISTVTATNGTFLIRTPRGSLAIKPYRNYRGGVWVRKVNFGPDLDTVYVAVPLASYPFGDIKFYDTLGSVISVEKIGGVYVTVGMRAEIGVDAQTNTVILVAGAQKGSGRLATYVVTPVGSGARQQIKLSAKPTQLRLGLLAENSSTMLLAAGNDRVSSLEAWVLNPKTTQFERQTIARRLTYRITTRSVEKK